MHADNTERSIELSVAIEIEEEAKRVAGVIESSSLLFERLKSREDTGVQGYLIFPGRETVISLLFIALIRSQYECGMIPDIIGLFY